MERRKKYTHITARVNTISKLVTKCKLKDLCNYTLSEAYWRIDEGKGLVHIYDQESFNIWSELMNQIAKMSSPDPLSKGQYEELCNIRHNLWNKMEEYRSWIDKGSMPIKLQSYANERNIKMPFIQNSISHLVTKESDISSLDIEVILRLAEHDEEKYHRIIKEKIEKGEITTYPLIAEARTSTYQIRADYSHKKSDSRLIRSRLDGIWNILPKTNEAHRRTYSENWSIIEDYTKWQKLKTRHELNSLLNFFERIKIPTMIEI